MIKKTIKRSIRLPTDVDRLIKDFSNKYNWSYSKVIVSILESFVYENE